jgi:hypothetical protein
VSDNPPFREDVEPCCRCGRPAERPVVGCDHVAGRDAERLPLCVDCLQLLLGDVKRFWDGLSRGRGSGRQASPAAGRPPGSGRP